MGKPTSTDAPVGDSHLGPHGGRDRTPLHPHMNRAFDDARAKAHAYFDSNGYDPEGRMEWPVAWGETDIFRHTNNVNYFRYMESSRMRWFETFAPDLGQDKANDIVNGRGMGIILKDMFVRFRAPVEYPDALIWAVKPSNIQQDRAQFTMTHTAWSLKSKKMVFTADCSIVIYDYDKTRKGTMSDEMRDSLLQRAAGVRAKL